MRKILFISSEAIGIFIAKRLSDRGNEVYYFCKSKEQESVGNGLKNIIKIKAPTFKLKENDKNPKKSEELYYKTLIFYLKPYLKKCDFTFFDDSGMGSLADMITSQGYKVVGSSSFMDELEIDRVLAFDIMKKYTSIKIPEYKEFNSIKKGIAFLEGEYGDKYVFKLFSDNGDKSLTYMSIDDENESLIEFMKTMENDKEEYVLQKIIPGEFVELSSEGWFNGNQFVDGAWNHTYEKKRLMDGDIGPQTGSAGSVIWSCDADRIIRTALLPLTPILKKNKYCGPIDINLIIQGDEAWFLEFTPRCGYAGIDCVLSLILDDPGEFLYKLSTGNSQEVSMSQDYAVAIGLTTLPMDGDPKDEKLWQGMKILNIPAKMEPYTYLQCCYWDQEGNPRATGTGGSVGTIVGTGETVEKAVSSAYEIIDKIKFTKDLLYRSDIGSDFKEKYEDLEEAGWL